MVCGVASGLSVAFALLFTDGIPNLPAPIAGLGANFAAIAVSWIYLQIMKGSPSASTCDVRSITDRSRLPPVMLPFVGFVICLLVTPFWAKAGSVQGLGTAHICMGYVHWRVCCLCTERCRS